MRKILLVAARDYNAAVRTKGFLIGLLLVPVLMGGGIGVFALFQKRVDTRERAIAVVDHTGLVAPALVEAAKRRNESEIYDKRNGRQVQPKYLVEVVPPDEADPRALRLALSQKVRAGELSGFLEIGKEAVNPGADAEAAGLAYHAENAAFDNARNWMVGPLNERLQSIRIRESGLDESTVRRLTRWTPVEALGLVTVDEATGTVQEAERSNPLQVILPVYALVLLMFVLIMAAVNPLAHSILEEKMHRITEVLLGSVRPLQLMLGKLLGAIGVAITMVAVYTIAGLLTARHLEVSNAVPYHALPWLIGYGVAALFMFGAMFLAVGAACNDLKESQSLMMPLWVCALSPMFVWFPVMQEPTRSFATWASLFPPWTPMLMLVRIASPVTIPAWQPWVGLAGVALFTLASVWAAGRIFRVAILMQGKPPRISELLRWALRG
jgi:ABC-2 type transport system permease protein